MTGRRGRPPGTVNAHVPRPVGSFEERVDAALARLELEVRAIMSDENRERGPLTASTSRTTRDEGRGRLARQAALAAAGPGRIEEGEGGRK